MTDTASLSGYTPLRRLGEGAAGTVMLARHEASGRLVAVKYLAPTYLQDPVFRERFRAEALLLEQVRHPNVVEIYDYVEGPTFAALVMEAVEGAPLREVLRASGPCRPEGALWVLRGSLLGLGSAHTLGVVHRDYKPENVLVDAQGTSKLLDFGIAVRAGSTGCGR